ncbi:MAG: hypothetical protein IJL87_01645 [Clostridia bacterium]|nr:hypothetical protein [Clostridia bacterium]
MKKFVSAFIAVLLVVLIVLTGIKFSPLIVNPVKEVDNSVYRGSFWILYVSKSPVFETKLSQYYDFITSENKLKELFAKDDSEAQYREKFAKVIEKKGELSEADKLFIDCAFGTWYCEYMAKTAELNSAWIKKYDKGILKKLSDLLYGNNAEEWRLYADDSFDMLKEASTTDDLKELKKYLKTRKAKMYF